MNFLGNKPVWLQIAVRTICLPVALSILLGWNLPALADEYFVERLRFLQARSYLHRGMEAEFLSEMKLIRDYPIQHYLLYAWLLRQMKSNNASVESEIMVFAKLYPASHLSWQLLAKWQKHLFKKNQWQRFIEVGTHLRASEFPCRTHEARLRSGQTTADENLLRDLLLNQPLNSKPCQQVSELVMKSVAIDTELLWSTIERAMQQGSWKRAQTLRHFLSDRDKKLLTLWIDAYRNPGDNADNPGLSEDTELIRQIVLQQHIRWSRYDIVAADKHWQEIRGNYEFTVQQREKVDRRIALRTANFNLPQAQQRLAALNVIDGQIRAWTIRVALRTGQWEQVIGLINALPKNERKDEQWRYWLVRGFEAQGDTDRARQLYEQLAGEASYYGFLAADRLGIDYAIRDESPNYSSQKKILMSRDIEAVRGREYLLVGLPADARRAWRRFSKSLEGDDLIAAASLADDWGWHDRAIFEVSRTRFKRFLPLRFPMPFYDEVFTNAKQSAIDPAWVYGVIRQESSFIADIRSPSGAVGLMQLMPTTAQYIAKKMGRSVRTRNLVNENLNISLGTNYLRNVMDRFENHQVLATAAYNAGPNRVKKWLPIDKPVDADIWVDTIPLIETRRYVRAVMAYTTIYEWRMQRRTTPLKQRMTEIFVAR
jgi:soluble lytic murein transglycosylase